MEFKMEGGMSGMMGPICSKKTYQQPKHVDQLVMHLLFATSLTVYMSILTSVGFQGTVKNSEPPKPLPLRLKTLKKNAINVHSTTQASFGKAGEYLCQRHVSKFVLVVCMDMVKNKVAERLVTRPKLVDRR